MALTSKNMYKKPVVELVASWDDGSLPDLKIAELLKEFRVPATFYITVDYVGRDGYVAWKDVRTLDSEPLFEIGSHTMSHPQDLKMLYEENLFYEIQNSKDMIETVLGHNIYKFCYPRGRHNETVRNLVARSGYLEARTTIVGKLEKGSDPLQVPTSVHVYDGRPEYKLHDWYTYATELFDEMLKNPDGKVFHVWGHGYEVEKGEEFQNLRWFLEYVTERAEIKGVSNG